MRRCTSVCVSLQSAVLLNAGKRSGDLSRTRLLRARRTADNVVDRGARPRGGGARDRSQRMLVADRERTREMADDTVVHTCTPQVAKRLQHRARDGAGTAQGARRGVLEVDDLRSNTSRARGAVGQVQELCRHLRRQPECVGGTSTRNLKTPAVLSRESVCDGLQRWSQDAEPRADPRKVVESSPKTADISTTHEPS